MLTLRFIAALILLPLSGRFQITRQIATAVIGLVGQLRDYPAALPILLDAVFTIMVIFMKAVLHLP